MIGPVPCAPRKQLAPPIFSSFLALAVGLLHAGPSQAQSDTVMVHPPGALPVRPHALTLTFGLGAPYGWGIDYGHRIVRNLEATVGAGYDFSGLKAGVGARYYLGEQRRFATFVGANVGYSGGREGVTVTSTEADGNPASETTRIRIRPCLVARLRVGARYQFSRRIGISTALGNGIAIGPDPIEYLASGPRSPSLQSLIETRRPDSLELSFALAVRFGR